MLNLYLVELWKNLQPLLVTWKFISSATVITLLLTFWQWLIGRWPYLDILLPQLGNYAGYFYMAAAIAIIFYGGYVTWKNLNSKFSGIHLDLTTRTMTPLYSANDERTFHCYLDLNIRNLTGNDAIITKVEWMPSLSLLKVGGGKIALSHVATHGYSKSGAALPIVVKAGSVEILHYIAECNIKGNSTGSVADNLATFMSMSSIGLLKVYSTDMLGSKVFDLTALKANREDMLAAALNS